MHAHSSDPFSDQIFLSSCLPVDPSELTRSGFESRTKAVRFETGPESRTLRYRDHAEPRGLSADVLQWLLWQRERFVCRLHRQPELVHAPERLDQPRA